MHPHAAQLAAGVSDKYKEFIYQYEKKPLVLLLPLSGMVRDNYLYIQGFLAVDE